MTQNSSDDKSPWEPLKISTFRWLWLATLVSNVGSWMHDVGAGWLMTTLTTSTVMVALVQSATSLPSFLLLLPSGALSDILDRRRYLIAGNLAMAATAVLLGVMTLTGHITAWGLLGLTFCLGCGMAMIMPTWQAIIPEVVPRSELKGAIALNTLGMNMSRVIGSLIAGVVISLLGIGAVFALNATTFIFIIWALLSWKRSPAETQLPPEGFFSAMRTGLRYTLNSPPLQATLIRGIGFFFFASVMWAFLPLVARVLLQGTSTTYSFLFASISVGAITSALVMPRIRKRVNSDQLISWASLIFACGLVVVATIHVFAVALAALAVCGACWITVMTCAQVSAQTALPNWVRSRGLAVFLTFFMGSLALGPFIWGTLAEFTTIPFAMVTAAAGITAASFYTRRWPVSGNDQLDHTPAGVWRKPEPLIQIRHAQGPVLVSISYQVADENREAFLSLMDLFGSARRRDGATDWNVMQHTASKNTYMEYFIVDTWLDHLRQHERISRQDAQLQQQIRALLIEGTAPHITHYIKPDREEGSGVSAL